MVKSDTVIRKGHKYGGEEGVNLRMKVLIYLHYNFEKCTGD